jgi:ketosteroid isomerase-like protein
MRRELGVAVLMLAVAASAAVAAEPKGKTNLRAAALEELRKVELDFAAHALKETWRDAFLAYFSDEGVWFVPGPSKTREGLAKMPAGQAKEKVEWYPTLTDASLGGDLGFNMGPYSWTFPDPAKPIGRGYFFTIWKRQPDGNFRVALDFGSEAPKPPSEKPADWKALRATGLDPSAKKATPADELAALETTFSKTLADRGAALGYGGILDAEAMMMRKSTMPLRGPAAIKAFVQSKGWKSAQFEVAYFDLATSGDFGYTYGQYTTTLAKDAGEIKGYYAHVWRRNAKGEWKLLFDVANVDPPQS